MCSNRMILHNSNQNYFEDQVKDIRAWNSKTKRECCERVILDWETKYKKKFVESDILLSGVLAVSAEYLGLLHEERWLLYAKTRAGILAVEPIRSFRDYLNTLED